MESCSLGGIFEVRNCLRNPEVNIEKKLGPLHNHTDYAYAPNVGRHVAKMDYSTSCTSSSTRRYPWKGVPCLRGRIDGIGHVPADANGNQSNEESARAGSTPGLGWVTKLQGA